MVHIYQVNEYDWVFAESLESAAEFYKGYTGEEIDYEEAYRLDDDELDTKMYHADEGEFGLEAPRRMTFREALQRTLEAGIEPPFLFASTEQ